MPRRLRSFLLLLPILLLALVLPLWARSYLPDRTFFRSHQGRLLIFFVAGDYVLWFDRNSAQYHSSETTVDYCRRVAQVQLLPSYRLAGFEWTRPEFQIKLSGIHRDSLLGDSPGSGTTFFLGNTAPTQPARALPPRPLSRLRV
jgi:hypothetical protein